MLPMAPAIDAPLDVPDRVHRPLVARRDVQDEVRAEGLALLDLTEDDVPHPELRRVLLHRVDPILCCYSPDGLDETRVVALDEGPHRASPGRVEDAAP